MRIVRTTGACLALVAAGFACVAPVVAQERKLSEEAVRKYIDYAWSMTPAKFTRPDGRTIEIDKKQKDKVVVPVDIGREVIMAARMSALAQACELAEDQVNNYRSLMLREEARKKWTEQQMIFINQLHLTTVMLLAGTIKIIELQDGGKEVELQNEQQAPKIKKPSDDECKKVREQIVAYVKTGPSLAPAGSATGVASSGSAAPVAATPTGAPATTGTTNAPKKQ